MTVALTLLQDRLEVVNTEIAEKVGSLVDERDDLNAAIAKLQGGRTSAPRGGGGGGSTPSSQPPIEAAEIVEGVKKAGGDKKSVSSVEIAAALNVDTRRVGRRLPALVEEGLLKGNPNAGYKLP